MIEKLLQYCKGYVLVECSGGNIERFFNLVSARSILIWEIVQKDNKIHFFITPKDVYELKAIIRKTKVKIRIKERFGLPFLMFLHRKRKMFFLGLLTSQIIIYVMSLYIWNISFEGNFYHTDDELRKFLKEIEIDEGIMKQDITAEKIEKALRNQYFDITWASVEVKGTKLIVHIRENNNDTNSTTNTDITTTGDIVASKDCTISSIITRKGTPMVKAGYTVKKGDILISGKYDIIGDDLSVIEERRVLADGDVIGTVVYNIDEIINREYVKKEYTGRQYEIYEYLLNKKSIDWKLWFNKEEYKKYDIESSFSQMVIGENFYLPLTIEKKLIREYEIKDAFYTEEEVSMLAEKKWGYILKKIEENTIQILENNVKIEVDGKVCRIYGQITVLENIGTVGGTYE